MKKLIAAAAIVGASLASPAWATSLVSGMNGRCLDVTGGNISHGQTLQTYECNGTPAQDFVWNSRGEIRIGNLCVDAYGGKGRKGDQIGLWTCHGGANQRWQQRGQAIVGIRNRCMDIEGRHGGNGARIILWDCHGRDNQAWTVHEGHRRYGHEGRRHMPDHRYQEPYPRREYPR